MRLSRSHRAFPGAVRLVAAGLAAVVSLPAAAAPLSGTGRTDSARARFLMGTTLHVEVPGGADPALFEEVFAEVARLEEVLSNWRAGSEISRLNRSGGAPFRCSIDLFAALEASLRWAAETGGAFDPTVEPLVRSFGIRGPEDVPGPGGETAGAPVGWRGVRLDAAERTARFDAAGAGVDFGGIGKGIALDAAARLLRARGVLAALLDFGGQVMVLGAPPGEAAWRIGIADPRARERPVIPVRVRDASASTSGNSERGAGARGGHILDPAARRPAAFDGTVTVVTRDATGADALSTALFVMGPGRGARWAGDHGVAALYLWDGVDGTLQRRATPAWERLPDMTTYAQRAAVRMEHRSAPAGWRHGP